MREIPHIGRQVTFRTKNKTVRPLVTGDHSSDDTNVIEFLPYLTAKQQHAAREATFLTLFLVFVSLFVVLA